MGIRCAVRQLDWNGQLRSDNCGSVGCLGTRVASEGLLVVRFFVSAQSGTVCSNADQVPRGSGRVKAAWLAAEFSAGACSVYE
jgi:hypothetical protein